MEYALVLAAACGDQHTLVVTTQGALWTCGEGEHSTLGSTRREARVDALCFFYTKIVSIIASRGHSVVVTEHSTPLHLGQDQKQGR